MAVGPTVRKMCGFKALKGVLMFINVIYIIIGILIIGVLIPLSTLHFYVAVAVPVGMAAVILIVIAILGIISVALHHQVTLFFYMVVLSIFAVFLLAVSIACTAFADQLTKQAFEAAWTSLSLEEKSKLQDSLSCCGFDDSQHNSTSFNAPSCKTSLVLTKPGGCCYQEPGRRQLRNDEDCPGCPRCFEYWKGLIANLLRVAGVFGILVTFSKVLCVILTYRYRNLKDPQANPQAYL